MKFRLILCTAIAVILACVVYNLRQSNSISTNTNNQLTWDTSTDWVWVGSDANIYWADNLNMTTSRPFCIDHNTVITGDADRFIKIRNAEPPAIRFEYKNYGEKGK